MERHTEEFRDQDTCLSPEDSEEGWEQQEVSHTKKDAGHLASPLDQLLRLAFLKSSRLPWTSIFLPTAWQPQNLTSVRSCPYPA